MQALVDSVQPAEDEAPSAEDEEPFDIRDVELAAKRIESAATAMRALVDDVDSGKLSSSFKELDVTSRSSIDHAADRIDRALDRILWIGLVLIAALFCTLTIARVLSNRLTRRHARA